MTGVMNLEYEDISTAEHHMKGLKSRLVEAGLVVAAPSVPRHLGIGSLQRQYDATSSDIDKKMAGYPGDIFPVLAGYSLGGINALKKYLELKNAGVDCAVITINSPHLGVRKNPFIPPVPVIGNVLTKMDPWSLRAAQIGQFALGSVENLQTRSDNGDVTFIGSTFDMFGALASQLPNIDGARRFALTQTGQPVKGFEDVETLGVPGVEHMTVPCRKAVSGIITRRVAEMVTGYAEADDSSNVIVGNFGPAAAAR